MLTFSNLSVSSDQKQLFKEVENWLSDQGLSVIQRDEERPWGGFFVLASNETSAFVNKFFNEVPAHCFGKQQQLSPKILIVAPDARLSWQYHHRRAELWKLIAGTAALRRSDTDDEGETHQLAIGELITLACGERHRLMGGKGWGVVAEIWMHTELEAPSNEDDIVRLQDDFGRK